MRELAFSPFQAIFSTFAKISFSFQVTFIFHLQMLSFFGILILLFGNSLKSQKRPSRKVFVYKILVDPIHTILKYGNYYDFMDR